MRPATRELNATVSNVHKVIRKRLRLYAYKIQIFKTLESDNRSRRMNFATEMLRRIEDDTEFLNRIMFFDKASFILSSIVNRSNVHIIKI